MQRIELGRLIEEACKKVDAMTPEELQAMLQAMLRAQFFSWCVGELMLEYPEMTREQAEKRISRAMSSTNWMANKPFTDDDLKRTEELATKYAREKTDDVA